MAVNIFDKYGIKEVANVYFEALEDDPRAGVYKGDIVLFLDTLKTSTIETSAEQTDARGGWGNPKLITWDYGKEITLTLTDALISLESLRFMLGGAIHKPEANEPVIVRHTEEVVVASDGYVPLPKDHLTGATLIPTAKVGHPIRLINLTKGYRTQITTDNADVAMSANGTQITFKNPAAGLDAAGEVAAIGDHIRIFWEEVITNNSGSETAVEVTISPDTFPGTYRVVGDTFMRSQETGKDEAFQFVINKAKVASNVTITLEAEGDPSTFEMQLTVLRSNNERGENEMMKLIRYAISESTSSASADDYGSIAAKGSI
jgi:hypothetical protein